MTTLDPVDSTWSKRHPVFATLLAIMLIAGVGTGLKFLQEKYFPVDDKEFTTPIFINETFKQVHMNFDFDSNLTKKEQNRLFDEKYRYNIVKWTCKPLSCREQLGKPTIKLICQDFGLSGDVRVTLQGNCTSAAVSDQATVAFQLISKTQGYYLGRAGKVVE